MTVDDGTPRDGSPGGEIHPHEMLSALLDGELALAEKAAVETHLRTCGACRVLLDDLRRLASASRAEPAPPIPADMGARIRRRLRADAVPARPARRPFWLAPFPLGAVAGLLLAVALLAPWYLSRVATPPIEPAVVEQAAPQAARERAVTVEPQPEGADGEPAIVPSPAAASPPKSLSAPGTVHLSAPSSRPSPATSDAPPPAPPPAALAAPRAGIAPPDATGATEGKEGDDAAAPQIVTAFRAEEVSGARGTTAAMAGPPPRTLRLITPAYRAEIVEDGRLTVETEGYSCTVAIPPNPAAPPPAGPMESRMADRAQQADPLALQALFALASASQSSESSVERSQAARVAVAEPPRAAAAPGRIVLEGPGGAILASIPYDDAIEAGSTPQSRELGRRIDRLVRERHILLLETICGPLPRALRPPG